MNPDSYVVVSHVGDGARFPVRVIGKEKVGDARVHAEIAITGVGRRKGGHGEAPAGVSEGSLLLEANQISGIERRRKNIESIPI